MAKLNKVKLVKKLSRQIKIPPGKVVPSRKNRTKRADWKRELKEQIKDE
jgi:hypothetical protein